MVVKRSLFGKHHIRPHRLAFHKLTYIYKGTGYMETAAGPISLAPGCLILTQPLVWHAYPKQDDRFEVIETMFDVGVLLGAMLPSFQPFPHLRHLLRSRIPTPETASPFVIRLEAPRRQLIAQNMMALYTISRSACASKAMSLQLIRLSTILFDATQNMNEAPQLAASVAAEKEVTLVLEQLTENFAEPHSLKALASLVQWHPAYLSRRFKATVGMSPIEYLNRIRVEKACYLLTATQLSISEIAVRTGFNEIPYFNRRFKKTLGNTPTDYRLGKTQKG